MTLKPTPSLYKENLNTAQVSTTKAGSEKYAERDGYILPIHASSTAGKVGLAGTF